MINLLIDEPIELNQKALTVMAAFKVWARPSYIGCKEFLKFTGSRVETLDFEALLEKSINMQDQIERDFNELVRDNLTSRDLSLDEAVKLDPNFLLQYRTNRDLSDLVVTAVSLEALQYQWRDYNRMLTKHAAYAMHEHMYLSCREFMKEFSPNALKFHDLCLEVKVYAA